MKKSLFDLDELYLFTQVFQHGSFAKVSRRLKIPKPTLSRKIQHLEECLGVQLFLRTTRSVRPSDIAKEFYHRALAVVAASDEARTLVQHSKQEPQGLLRIAAGVEYGTLVVSPAVNAFCKKHPRVDVELDLSGRHVDLVQEGFDVAIRIGLLADSSLASRRVGSVHYGLYASSVYLSKASELTHPEDLVRHQTLLFTRSRHGETWHFVNKNQDRAVVQTQPRFRSNHVDVLKNAAESGLGIAFVPHFMVKDSVDSGRLIPLLSDWTSEEKPIHVLYPAQKFVVPKARAFVDFFCQFVQKKSQVKNRGNQGG